MGTYYLIFIQWQYIISSMIHSKENILRTHLISFWLIFSHKDKELLQIFALLLKVS